MGLLGHFFIGQNYGSMGTGMQPYGFGGMNFGIDPFSMMYLARPAGEEYDPTVFDSIEKPKEEAK